MKVKLINVIGGIVNSKFNRNYRIKNKETRIVKTVFFDDGDFCRGATYIRHIIDHGQVHAIERIKEDNFDGKGKSRDFLCVIGQKYNSYIYKKPCIVV